MSYQTFYRKYRSNTFDEMVGQDHIKQTLKNAIATDRLSHAYIFSGPRGTGKTSTARILAKTINCLHPEKAPCLTCATCTRIARGNAVDVIEIDAASNTGVDHMRTLNEQVHFAPVECSYKLYIIDEAHMLSIGAFNALLKTLEEPPAKTVFVLATTEPHKIPVTIHSRCQHLYFHQLTVAEISNHLQEIVQKEGIQISEKSIATLAKNAGGCMRDALSLLDQLFSFKGQIILDEDVFFLLGTAQDEHLFKMMAAYFKADISGCVAVLESLFDDGSNVYQLLSDILRVCQDLLMVKLGLTETVAATEAQKEWLTAIAKEAPFSRIQDTLDILSKTEFELKTFSQPELLLKIRLLSGLKKQDTMPAQQAVPAAAKTGSTPQAVPVAPRSQAQAAPVHPQPYAAKSVVPMPASTVTVAPAVAAPSVPTPSEKKPGSWSAYLETMKKRHTGIYAVLKGSSVVKQTETHIYVRLKQNFKFFEEKLKEENTLNIIQNVLQEVYGTPLKFELMPYQASESGSGHTDENVTGEADTSKTAASSGQDKYESGDVPYKINTIVSMFEGTLL